jgi:hypothetical protein
MVRAVKEYDKSIGFYDQTLLSASVMIMSIDEDNECRIRSNEDSICSSTGL